MPVSSIFIVMAMFVPLTDEYVWAKLLASILILIVNLFTFYNYNELQESGGKAVLDAAGGKLCGSASGNE